MNKTRTELGYKPEHWTSEDGHLHISVPTTPPEAWKRTRQDGETSVYTSGEYEIRSRAYGLRVRTYTVWRDGVELPLSFTGSLRDAKARAATNALGEDRMNVA